MTASGLKSRKSVFLKGLSAITAFIFLFSEFSLLPVLAAPASSPSVPASVPTAVTEIILPEEIGTIEDRFEGASSRNVIIIQDAHAIPDAQRSIRKAILYFYQKYAVRHVGLEGASAEIDANFLKSFPDKPRLLSVLKEYMDAGELAGGTAAAISGLREEENSAAGTRLEFAGIEDWPVYEEALRLYQRAAGSGEEISNQIKPLKAQLEREKKAGYSERLLRVDRALNDFRTNQKDFLQVLETLNEVEPPPAGSELELLLEQSRKSGVESGANLVVEARALADKIDLYFKSAARQDKELQAEFQALRQQYRTSQITEQAFALALQGIAGRAGIRLEVSDELLGMVRQEKRMRDLEGTRLFTNFEQYAQTIKESLFEDAEDRGLDQRDRRLWLAEKLSRLEVTYEEWKEILEMRQAGRWQVDGQAMNLMTELFEPHFAFYENSERRDEIFLKNLMRDDAQVQPAMIVAGGFHAHGLCQSLREKQISHVLVMPSIKSMPEESRYRQQMQGDFSWKNYFKVEDGKVNLYDAFMRGIRDRLLDVQPSALKPWRDQILRDLADQGRLVKAGEYTRFIDELSGASAEDPVQKRLKAVDQFLEGLARLEKEGKFDAAHIARLLPSATAQSLIVGGYQPGLNVSADIVGLADPSAKSEVRSTVLSKTSASVPQTFLQTQNQRSANAVGILSTRQVRKTLGVDSFVVTEPVVDFSKLIAFVSKQPLVKMQVMKTATNAGDATVAVIRARGNGINNYIEFRLQANVPGFIEITQRNGNNEILAILEDQKQVQTLLAVLRRRQNEFLADASSDNAAVRKVLNDFRVQASPVKSTPQLLKGPPAPPAPQTSRSTRPGTPRPVPPAPPVLKSAAQPQALSPAAGPYVMEEAYGRMGGWKIHLTLSRRGLTPAAYEKQYREIEKWLEQNVKSPPGSRYKAVKMRMSFDPAESLYKDITVYLGSRALAEKVALDLENRFGSYLDEYPLEDDETFGKTGKVKLRFDTKATDQEKGNYDAYGLNGVPISQALFNAYMAKAEKENKKYKDYEKEAVEKTHRELEYVYGEYYTGVPESTLIQNLTPKERRVRELKKRAAVMTLAFREKALKAKEDDLIERPRQTLDVTRSLTSVFEQIDKEDYEGARRVLVNLEKYQPHIARNKNLADLIVQANLEIGQALDELFDEVHNESPAQADLAAKSEVRNFVFQVTDAQTQADLAKWLDPAQTSNPELAEMTGRLEGAGVYVRTDGSDAYSAEDQGLYLLNMPQQWLSLSDAQKQALLGHELTHLLLLKEGAVDVQKTKEIEAGLQDMQMQEPDMLYNGLYDYEVLKFQLQNGWTQTVEAVLSDVLSVISTKPFGADKFHSVLSYTYRYLAVVLALEEASDSRASDFRQRLGTYFQLSSREQAETHALIQQYLTPLVQGAAWQSKERFVEVFSFLNDLQQKMRSEVRSSLGVKGEWFLNWVVGPRTERKVYNFPEGSPFYHLTQKEKISWAEAEPFLAQDRAELEDIAREEFGDASYADDVLSIITSRMGELLIQGLNAEASGSVIDDGRYKLYMSRAVFRRPDVFLIYDAPQGETRTLRLNQQSIYLNSLGVFYKGDPADNRDLDPGSNRHWDQTYPFSPKQFWEHHVGDEAGRIRGLDRINQEFSTLIDADQNTYGTTYAKVIAAFRHVYSARYAEGQHDEQIESDLRLIFKVQDRARRDGQPFNLMRALESAAHPNRTLPVLEPLAEHVEIAAGIQLINKKLQELLPGEGYALEAVIEGEDIYFVLRQGTRQKTLAWPQVKQSTFWAGLAGLEKILDDSGFIFSYMPGSRQKAARAAFTDLLTKDYTGQSFLDGAAPYERFINRGLLQRVSLSDRLRTDRNVQLQMLKFVNQKINFKGAMDLGSYLFVWNKALGDWAQTQGVDASGFSYDDIDIRLDNGALAARPTGARILLRDAKLNSEYPIGRFRFKEDGNGLVFSHEATPERITTGALKLISARLADYIDRHPSGSDETRNLSQSRGFWSGLLHKLFLRKGAAVQAQSERGAAARSEVRASRTGGFIGRFAPVFFAGAALAFSASAVQAQVTELQELPEMNYKVFTPQELEKLEAEGKVQYLKMEITQFNQKNYEYDSAALFGVGETLMSRGIPWTMQKLNEVNQKLAEKAPRETQDRIERVQESWFFQMPFAFQGQLILRPDGYIGWQDGETKVETRIDLKTAEAHLNLVIAETNNFAENNDVEVRQTGTLLADAQSAIEDIRDRFRERAAQRDLDRAREDLRRAEEGSVSRGEEFARNMLLAAAAMILGVVFAAVRYFRTKTRIGQTNGGADSFSGRLNTALPEQKFGGNSVDFAEAFVSAAESVLGYEPIVAVSGSLAYLAGENGQPNWDDVQDIDLNVYGRERVSPEQHEDIMVRFFESLSARGVGIHAPNINFPEGRKFGLYGWGIQEKKTGRVYGVQPHYGAYEELTSTPRFNSYHLSDVYFGDLGKLQEVLGASGNEAVVNLEAQFYQDKLAEIKADAANPEVAGDSKAKLLKRLYQLAVLRGLESRVPGLLPVYRKLDRQIRSGQGFDEGSFQRALAENLQVLDVAGEQSLESLKVDLRAVYDMRQGELEASASRSEVRTSLGLEDLPEVQRALVQGLLRAAPLEFEKNTGFEDVLTEVFYAYSSQAGSIYYESGSAVQQGLKERFDSLERFKEFLVYVEDRIRAAPFFYADAENSQNIMRAYRAERYNGFFWQAFYFQATQFLKDRFELSPAEAEDFIRPFRASVSARQDAILGKLNSADESRNEAVSLLVSMFLPSYGFGGFLDTEQNALKLPGGRISLADYQKRVARKARYDSETRSVYFDQGWHEHWMTWLIGTHLVYAGAAFQITDWLVRAFFDNIPVLILTSLPLAIGVVLMNWGLYIRGVRNMAMVAPRSVDVGGYLSKDLYPLLAAAPIAVDRQKGTAFHETFHRDLALEGEVFESSGARLLNRTFNEFYAQYSGFAEGRTPEFAQRVRWWQEAKKETAGYIEEFYKSNLSFKPDAVPKQEAGRLMSDAMDILIALDEAGYGLDLFEFIAEFRLSPMDIRDFVSTFGAQPGENREDYLQRVRKNADSVLEGRRARQAKIAAMRRSEVRAVSDEEYAFISQRAEELYELVDKESALVKGERGEGKKADLLAALKTAKDLSDKDTRGDIDEILTLVREANSYYPGRVKKNLLELDSIQLKQQLKNFAMQVWRIQRRSQDEGARSEVRRSEALNTLKGKLEDIEDVPEKTAALIKLSGKAQPKPGLSLDAIIEGTDQASVILSGRSQRVPASPETEVLARSMAEALQGTDDGILKVLANEFRIVRNALREFLNKRPYEFSEEDLENIENYGIPASFTEKAREDFKGLNRYQVQLIFLAAKEVLREVYLAEDKVSTAPKAVIVSQAESPAVSAYRSALNKLQLSPEKENLVERFLQLRKPGLNFDLPLLLKALEQGASILAEQRDTVEVPVDTDGRSPGYRLILELFDTDGEDAGAEAIDNDAEIFRSLASDIKSLIPAVRNLIKEAQFNFFRDEVAQIRESRLPDSVLNYFKETQQLNGYEAQLVYLIARALLYENNYARSEVRSVAEIEADLQNARPESLTEDAWKAVLKGLQGTFVYESKQADERAEYVREGASHFAQVFDFLSREFPGRYAFVQFINGGGEGEVYQLRDRETGRVLALKVAGGELWNAAPFISKGNLYTNGQTIQAFEKFLKDNGKWNQTAYGLPEFHGTVRLEDSADEELDAFLWEFVEGVNFEKAVQQGQISKTVWLDTIRSFLTDLAAAGFAYRDAKFGVIVTPENRLAVVDLGLISPLAKTDEDARMAAVNAGMKLADAYYDSLVSSQSEKDDISTDAGTTDTNILSAPDSAVQSEAKRSEVRNVTFDPEIHQRPGGKGKVFKRDMEFKKLSWKDEGSEFNVFFPEDYVSPDEARALASAQAIAGLYRQAIERFQAMGGRVERGSVFNLYFAWTNLDFPHAISDPVKKEGNVYINTPYFSDRLLLHQTIMHETGHNLVNFHLDGEKLHHPLAVAYSEGLADAIAGIEKNHASFFKITEEALQSMKGLTQLDVESSLGGDLESGFDSHLSTVYKGRLHHAFGIEFVRAFEDIFGVDGDLNLMELIDELTVLNEKPRPDHGTDFVKERIRFLLSTIKVRKGELRVRKYSDEQIESQVNALEARLHERLRQNVFSTETGVSFLRSEVRRRESEGRSTGVLDLSYRISQGVALPETLAKQRRADFLASYEEVIEAALRPLAEKNGWDFVVKAVMDIGKITLTIRDRNSQKDGINRKVLTTTRVLELAQRETVEGEGAGWVSMFKLETIAVEEAYEGKGLANALYQAESGLLKEKLTGTVVYGELGNPGTQKLFRRYYGGTKLQEEKNQAATSGEIIKMLSVVGVDEGGASLRSEIRGQARLGQVRRDEVERMLSAPAENLAEFALNGRLPQEMIAGIAAAVEEARRQKGASVEVIAETIRTQVRQYVSQFRAGAVSVNPDAVDELADRLAGVLTAAFEGRSGGVTLGLSFNESDGADRLAAVVRALGNLANAGAVEQVVISGTREVRRNVPAEFRRQGLDGVRMATMPDFSRGLEAYLTSQMVLPAVHGTDILQGAAEGVLGLGLQADLPAVLAPADLALLQIAQTFVQLTTAALLAQAVDEPGKLVTPETLKADVLDKMLGAETLKLSTVQGLIQIDQGRLRVSQQGVLGLLQVISTQIQARSEVRKSA